MNRNFKRGILAVTRTEEAPNWDENHGDSIAHENVVNETSYGFAQTRSPPPTTHNDIVDETIYGQSQFRSLAQPDDYSNWDEKHGYSIAHDNIMEETAHESAQPRSPVPTNYDDEIVDETIFSQPHPFDESIDLSEDDDDDMTQSDIEEAHDDDDEDTIPLQLKSNARISEHSPFTQALEKDNSGDGASTGHKACFQKTLMLFKGHLQNQLSLAPDPLHENNIQDWKKTLDQSKVDPQQILNLFNTEMKSFVDVVMEIPAQSTGTRNMEFLGDMLAGKLTIPKQPKLVQLKPTVEKKKPALIKGVAKKYQTMCRSCGVYFRKGPENKFICQKVECQDRKCKECEEDRVCAKNKKCCKKCSEAK